MGGCPGDAMLKRGLMAALIVLLLCALVAPGTLAIGIGVNKAFISYADVLQNGYAQDDVLVTTDSPTPITGTYEFTGDIAPWLRVTPPDQNFTFSNGQPYRLTIIVEPPKDAQLVNYTGGVRILTGEVARTGGGKIGTVLRGALLIKIGLGLTGTQLIACRAGGIEIKNTEIGQPFDFIASISNKGNVRIRPDFTILIYDQYQTKLVKNITLTATAEILPTATGEMLLQVSQDLPVGQYWARVDVPLCGDSAFLTFDVLDRGGIADNGELLNIDVNPWAKTGDIIPIYAVFKNTGSRVVSAKFKGTITTEDGQRIMKVIDTDLYNVPPSATARIETFFNPTEPGRFIIAGRVLYNSKLTFQKSVLLNVAGPLMVATQQWGGIALLFLFVIIVLLLLILITKRRRRQRPQRTGYGHTIVRR
jgi:hypothetical protein